MALDHELARAAKARRRARKARRTGGPLVARVPVQFDRHEPVDDAGLTPAGLAPEPARAEPASATPVRATPALGTWRRPQLPDHLITQDQLAEQARSAQALQDELAAVRQRIDDAIVSLVYPPSTEPDDTENPPRRRRFSGVRRT